MKGYNSKKRYKIYIFISAIGISLLFLFLISNLYEKVRADEREKVLLWAQAIQKKSVLVDYTHSLFEKLKKEERNKVDLWYDATQRLLNAGENEPNLDFYVNIIKSNKNIPIVLTDTKDTVVSTINATEDIKLFQPFDPEIKKEFLKQKRIKVELNGEVLSYLYYKDSKLFEELQLIMDEYVNEFMTDVVKNTASVPVIITESDLQTVVTYGNVDSTLLATAEQSHETINDFAEYNAPIEIKFSNQPSRYIFYKDSEILQKIKHYPLLVAGIILLFILVAYLAFTSSRKFEQNQVWVGMSKETAHQLGTPISSLMAWIELLKLQDIDSTIIDEINKDVTKLKIVADRFSKIGSEPTLTMENAFLLVSNTVEYMKSRSSSKITYSISGGKDSEVAVNMLLFGWVLENLLKNAIDAMEGKGAISIAIAEADSFISIDLSDTGKGVHRNKFKTVFKPGYTTKKRGWGLGLSLVKRIINEYHNGKIFIKSSEIGKGTTFRILLPAEVKSKNLINRE